MDINPTPQTPPAPSHDDTILNGRFGLRAGWGIAIYLVLFTILAFGLNAARHIVQNNPAFSKHSQTSLPSSGITSNSTLFGEAPILIGVALASWLLSRIEHRRIVVYGIGRNRLSDFLPAAFWGLACLSLLVGILRAAHVLVFDTRLLSGPAIFISGAKWLLAFLVVGMLEEYLTRGYLQYTLTRGLLGLGEMISPTNSRAAAFWIATIIMSFIFGYGHLTNPGETAIGILSVFLAGAVFSYALFRTGSLWWSIGFHTTWDWAQSFLYGVPDSGGISDGRLFQTHPAGNPLLSGGPTGPEGSLLVIPMLMLIAVIVRFTTSPGIQPTFEPLSTPHILPPDTPVVIA